MTLELKSTPPPTKEIKTWSTEQLYVFHIIYFLKILFHLLGRLLISKLILKFRHLYSAVQNKACSTPLSHKQQIDNAQKSSNFG